MSFAKGKTFTPEADNFIRRSSMYKLNSCEERTFPWGIPDSILTLSPKSDASSCNHTMHCSDDIVRGASLCEFIHKSGAINFVGCFFKIYEE